MKESTTPKTQAYDLIGDIHGHADALEALLDKLGYNWGLGHYKHPEGRKVIFLGDFIDRGPNIPRTLEIAMSMWQHGSALAILGNHEANALAYHSLNEHGEPLRPHSDRNRAQHEATLEQFKEKPLEWQKALSWFAQLPLYLDLGGLRAVHAAWEPRLLLFFPTGCIGRDHIADAQGERWTPEGKLVKRATCGLEIALPDGHEFTDSKGGKHPDIRAAWWKNLKELTYAGALFPPGGDAPDIAIPCQMIPSMESYCPQEKPLFFGHYWLNPSEMPLAPLEKNIACLDYSIARGGSLIAYRWDGESELKADKFVAVDATAKPPQEQGGFTAVLERMKKALPEYRFDPVEASKFDYSKSMSGVCSPHNADPSHRRAIYERDQNVEHSAENAKYLAGQAAAKWLGPAIRATQVIDTQHCTGALLCNQREAWKVYYELVDAPPSATGGRTHYVLVEKQSYEILGRGTEGSE